MKAYKFSHTEKPQSWPAVTPDRWYCSVTQYPNKALESVTVTLPGHRYSTSSGWNTLSARQAKLQAGAGFRQQPQSRARLKLLMGSLTLQPFYCCYLLRQPIQDTYSCSKLQFRLLAQWYLTGHFKQHKLLENTSFYHLCTEVLWFGHTNQPPCATPTNCCTPVLTHLRSAQFHCYPQQLQNGFQHQGLLLSSSELSRNILLAEGLRAQESIFHRNNQKKTSKSTLIGAEDSFLGSSSGLEQNALKVASITIAFKIKFNISFLKLTSL